VENIIGEDELQKKLQEIRNWWHTLTAGCTEIDDKLKDELLVLKQRSEAIDSWLNHTCNKHTHTHTDQLLLLCSGAKVHTNRPDFFLFLENHTETVK